MPGGQVLDGPVYFVVLGLLCGLVGFRLGWRTRSVAGLPVLQGLLGWIGFAAAWRGAGAFAGVLAVAGWAIGSSLVALYRFKREIDEVDARVMRAATYRVSMLDWLRSGRGPESRPWRTAFEHARELALYLGAAVVSANLLSVIMGAVLLNYMNAYVAWLLTRAERPGEVALLGWNVWSIVRVLAYVALGGAAAAPLAARLGFGADPWAIHVLWIVGLSGAALDLFLKLLLSRPCGRRLASAVRLDP